MCSLASALAGSLMPATVSWRLRHVLRPEPGKHLLRDARRKRRGANELQLHRLLGLAQRAMPPRFRSRGQRLVIRTCRSRSPDLRFRSRFIQAAAMRPLSMAPPFLGSQSFHGLDPNFVPPLAHEAELASNRPCPDRCLSRWATSAPALCAFRSSSIQSHRTDASWLTQL